MDYKLHHSVKKYLAKVESHTQPYTTKVLGKEILVYPRVMSPKYDYSSTFHIKNMPNQKDKIFLEIGSGCGIISLFTALQGAKVTAVDINPDAVNNTQTNFQKYGLKARIECSDVFEKIKEDSLFDTIAFAAPYHNVKPTSFLEMGVTDYNYDTLKRFLRDAKKHLYRGGEIHLGFSNTGDLETLNTEIIKNMYKVVDIKKEAIEDWEARLYILKPRILTGSEKYFYKDDERWFQEYKEFIDTGSILKIGNGKGYATDFIKLNNQKTTSIDVIANGADIIYDGKKIPYKNDKFDTTICCYTLHHAENPESLFDEIVRTSKKRIIILEETYNNTFQKINLVANCVLKNFSAGQKIDFHWNSYMSRATLKDLIKKHDLKIIKQHTERKESYYKELFILEKK